MNSNSIYLERLQSDPVVCHFAVQPLPESVEPLPESVEPLPESVEPLPESVEPLLESVDLLPVCDLYLL